MAKFASIDFEYNKSSEPDVNLVCVSIRLSDRPKKYSIWLHQDDKNCRELHRLLQHLNSEGYVFLSYSVTAEARSFLALNAKPLEYKWIDLYLEYRCLTNHNHNYMYGKQLQKGKKKVTRCPKPKWERTEEDNKKAQGSKPEHNYGAAVYKSLGIEIDNEFKKQSRDLIISAPDYFTEDEKASIMDYCDSDTIYLIPMLKEFLKEYKRLLKKDYCFPTLLKGMYARSEYAVRTAIMERIGYPFNYKNTLHFSNQIDNIIWKCQSDIAKQFPLPLFRAKVKKRPFELSWDQTLTKSMVREWCRENNFKSWTKTKGGDLSLALDAFSKPVAYRHTYPEGNFLAQMQRYLKLKQGLNGFKINAKSSDSTFWSFTGTDHRCRPYMGIYGAQSARSQPSAKSFIPLKAAWMRSLIEPKVGRAICGIDYASQEFLIAALLSGDMEMLKAYQSGDVYLAFGKSVGYIPQDATKKTHQKQRDECKHVVLGLQFDMSEFGLSTDLTEKLGRVVSKEEALGWIAKHKRAYRVFWAWKEKLQRTYKIKKRLELPDGWIIWGDNPNFRSIGNVPIQGFGSSVMRKAVALCQDAGLDVIYTLHDALYIEYDFDKTEEVLPLFANCMDAAFRFYFEDELQDVATVRLDADIWSPSYPEEVTKFTMKYFTDTLEEMDLPTKQQQTYIDERAIDDYHKFKGYFTEPEYETLEF